MAFFYAGGLAFVVGGVLAFLMGRPARRGWWIVGLGGLLMLAFLVYEWSKARTDSLACHDCYVAFGRYGAWDLVLFFGLLNWVTWSLGAALGTGLRAVIHARQDLREQRGAA